MSRKDGEYNAVAEGFNTGVDEYKAQTYGYSGTQFKIFSSESDARNFWSGQPHETSTSGAGIGVYLGPNDSMNVSEPLEGRQTNNPAEIGQTKALGDQEVTVNTESEIMVKSKTEWMGRWQRNDWKTASGEPVKNREDFAELNDLFRGMKELVSDYSGNVDNEGADQLA